MSESSSAPDRGNILVLGAPTVIALWFISSFALPYLTVDPAGFGIYWNRHQWVYPHVVAGILALLLGPAQFWMGINRRAPILHRILGVGYVLSVVVSGIAAFYLAQLSSGRRGCRACLYRTLNAAFDIGRLGSLVDRMTAAVWLAWTAPLVITEFILQGRKIFAPRLDVAPLPDVSTDSAAPEPMPFGLEGSESSYLHRQ